MKWFILCVSLLLLFSFVYLSFNRPSFQRSVAAESLNGRLCDRLQESVLKRIPKGRSGRVREFPMPQPWHRMTNYLTLHLEVPSIKTEDPEEALKLSLPYLQAYVDAINNVREIRPYLMNFPMDFLMMNFIIGFAKDEKTHLPLYDPYIASLLFDGNLRITRFYKNITFPNGRVCTNAYDNVYDQSKGLPEAIKQMEIPRFDVGKPENPIPIPQATEYRYLNDSAKNEFDFLTDFAKQNNLIFIALESAFPYPIDPVIFGDIAFAAQERLVTLEEAKQLALKIQKEYILFAIKMGWFDHHINKARVEGREAYTGTINAQRYVGFRVSFWDKYIDRVKPPAIAEFRVYGTKACYYVADEYQRLQLVHEEEFPRFEVDVPLSEELKSGGKGGPEVNPN